MTRRGLVLFGLMSVIWGIPYVNPAVAAVLGVLVLNETFTVPMGIGFALVILGSTLATRRSQAAPGPHPTSVDAALGPAQK